MHIDSAAVMGEFIGTAVLLFLGQSVVAGVSLQRSKARDAGWMVVTTAWGLAVFLGIYVAKALGDLDGHLNPAFTIASVMMTGHADRLLTYIPAQLAGGFIGSVCTWLFFWPHWAITPDREAKLGVFCTIPAVRNLKWNFVAEALATFMLVMGATALASKRINPGGSPPEIGPVLVGGLVWSIGLSLGATTGYAINPARDVAPRFAHSVLPIAGKGASDWGYGWVPALGPCCGAAVAALFIDWTGMQ